MVCPKCGLEIKEPRDVNVILEMRVQCPGDLQQNDDGSHDLFVMFWDQILIERDVIAVECKCGHPLHDTEDWRKSMNTLAKFNTHWVDD
jgi:hypothetical protein